MTAPPGTFDFASCGTVVSVPEDIQWFLFGDRSFVSEDVHIDEIVAAAQNLLEKPRGERGGSSC